MPPFRSAHFRRPHTVVSTPQEHGAIMGPRARVSYISMTVPEPFATTSTTPEFGPAGLFVFDPTGAAVAEDLGPLMRVFHYEIHRYVNRIGTFQVFIPVDNQVIEESGEPLPLQTRIKRGWRISIVQEGSVAPTGDDHLLNYGMVINASFQALSDTYGLLLEGLFHEADLTERSTRKNLVYEDESGASIINDLITGQDMLVEGAIMPSSASTRELSITFDRITRYEALLEVLQKLRYNLRESWNGDQLEIVSRDNLPNKGITLTNMEGLNPEDALTAASKGMGIIGGAIGIREEGALIANRIIPVGVDTVEAGTGSIKSSGMFAGAGGKPSNVGIIGGANGTPTAEGSNADELDLQFADESLGGYEIETDLNPDGTIRRFLQDQESIDRYGLVEFDLRRTDIINRVDSTASRQRAANALYLAANGELIRRRAATQYINALVLNGHDIWLLPGDRTKLQFAGNALTEHGQFVWKDIDDYFIVLERVDTSRPAGGRQVVFQLGKPEFREDLGESDDGEEIVQIDIPGVDSGGPDSAGCVGSVACPPPTIVPVGGSSTHIPGYGYPVPPEPVTLQNWATMLINPLGSGNPNGCGGGCDCCTPGGGGSTSSVSGMKIPPAEPDIGEHEFVIWGRTSPVNFTAGLPQANVFFDGEPTMYGSPFFGETLNLGDHRLRLHVKVQNHGTLGVDGAVYDVTMSDGIDTYITHRIGPMLKGDIVEFDEDAVAHDVPAGRQFRWGFTVVANSSTLRLCPGGAGGSEIDDESSYMELQRITDAP